MKKTIFVFAVALLVAVSAPSLTNAAGLTEMQINSILTLLQSFGADQATVNNVQVSLRGGTPTGGGATPQPAFCYNWTRNLRDGDTGEDVRALHTALSLERPRILTQAVSSNEFDEVTGSAVTAFQEKYASEILTPNGLAHGNGAVRISTRAKLNALYRCSSTPIVTRPSITITSPTNGGQTTSLTPTILGTASGVNQVGVVLSNAGGKVYGSGLISVVNGNWSVTVAPALVVGQYTITVYDANNNQLTSGYLNIVSSAQPSITVTSPNGGENWQTGSIQSVRWTGNNQGKNIAITLKDYTEGSRYGTQYTIRGNSVWGNGQDSRNVTDGFDYYAWIIPSSIPNGSNYKVFVADVTPNTPTSGNTDGSDAFFTISTPTVSANRPYVTQTPIISSAPTITSISPVSGSKGTVITITGTNFSATRNEIQLSRVEGGVAKGGTITIPNRASNGSTITFPAPDSTYGEYVIVVDNGSETSVYPNAYAKFTLTASAVTPTISAVSPASGRFGTIVTVTGTNFAETGNEVQMTLLVNGDSKGTITIPNLLSYDNGKTLKFTAENYTYGTYSISVFNGSEFSAYPNTVAKFTLTAPGTLSVLTPTSDGGGSRFATADKMKIEWASTGVSGVKKITLTPSTGGTPISVLDIPASELPLTANSYIWTVPTTVPSGTYKVGVTIGANTLFAESTGTVYISNPAIPLVERNVGLQSTGNDSASTAPTKTLTVLTPVNSSNGISTFKQGEPMSIKWSSTGVRGVSLIKLIPTTSHSSTEATVLDLTSVSVLPLTTDSYNWTVPLYLPIGKYKVLVQIGRGTDALVGVSVGEVLVTSRISGI